MEKKEKKALFQVGKFRFENEHIEKWVDIKVVRYLECVFEIKKTNITPLNPKEALLSFNFNLELLPNTARITFKGDCLLISPKVKILILILKAKKNSKIRNRNQPFMKALNKLLLRRCMDHAKEIGEKKGIRFENYENILQDFGIDKISFNNPKKKTFSLKGDSLVPKQKENGDSLVKEK